ncbi:MAG: response regulator [Eubacteriales bacterium]|nr:response regulator [Eubacteriales bacterium]
MDNTAFGILIRSLRKQNNLTQTDLADKMNLTNKAISKWERGLSFPDISLFPTLADVLGVTVEDLVSACSAEAVPSRLIEIFKLSHDIRTPLNAILGYTSLATMHMDDPEVLKAYLDNIYTSGKYLLDTINEVMELAHNDKAAVNEDAADYRPSDLNTIIASYSFSGRCILLTEDNELNREIAGELLREIGINVEYAEDGLICLDKVVKMPADHYDLILMDIQMPNMSGIEATRAIRALSDKTRAAIPIVAMTANVYAEDREAAFAAGMDGFVEKPVNITQLYNEIGKVLGEDQS